jgi:hypothetical protein
MSSFPAALGPLITGAVSELETVLLVNRRSIAGIFPDVVISERHDDQLTISDHPVEAGVKISDHCYLEPAELVMLVGWSPSSTNQLGAITGGISDVVSAGLNGGLADVIGLLAGDKISDVYQQLLDLQAKREKFSVVTGKRVYDNMLLKSLRVTTDRETENVLMVEATFREIIIVSTQTATLPPLTAQLNPADTASPIASSPTQPIEDKSVVLQLKEKLDAALKNTGATK